MKTPKVRKLSSAKETARRRDLEREAWAAFEADVDRYLAAWRKSLLADARKYAETQRTKTEKPKKNRRTR